MSGETKIPSFDEIIQIQREMGSILLHNWKATSAFNGHWWFLLAVSLLIWVIGLFLFEKKNTYPFILIIVISHFIFSFIDGKFIGIGMIHYTIRLIPIQYPFIPVSFSFIPVAAVFLYKYCARWKIYIIGVFVTSLLLTLAFKYILLPLHVVTFHRGTYLYLFPWAFVTFILSRYLTEKILLVQLRHQE
jgi:hypothetical protein